jgi:3',5'-cyclic AMP phosphodiesterase CpdA
VTVQLLHVADLHFGRLADIRQIEALEHMIPDLRPDAVIVAGDLSQRARHGEFQRARAFTNAAAETAPVLVIPGNHDVQWWWRPLIPFANDVLYHKYQRYFGADLTPTLTIPGGAVLATALTSHGVAWGSLTTRVRDLAVKGHLPKRDILRVQRLFAEADPALARVLVVHHNVLRGDISQRMGLARWHQAQRRIVASGADVVLCGHDHQEGADVLEGKVVVSTAGTLSTRSRGGRPSCFNFVTIDPTAVHVTFFRWEAERGRFRASDTFAFARGQGGQGGQGGGRVERRDLPAPTAASTQPQVR